MLEFINLLVIVFVIIGFFAVCWNIWCRLPNFVRFLFLLFSTYSYAWDAANGEAFWLNVIGATLGTLFVFVESVLYVYEE